MKCVESKMIVSYLESGSKKEVNSSEDYCEWWGRCVEEVLTATEYQTVRLETSKFWLTSKVAECDAARDRQVVVNAFKVWRSFI
jgi:hypothetical protein